MARQVAMHRDGMWTGTVDTEPHATSGWHHHPGDFLRVPAGAVHRESNPSEEPGRAVIVRCGSGEPTINVDGPA
jgi:uncharacterized RmlC-like cupin family protein